MLGMEIAYIKGDYTPFEEFSEFIIITSFNILNNDLIEAAEETSSGGIVIIDKPEVIRKRKRS